MRQIIFLWWLMMVILCNESLTICMEPWSFCLVGEVVKKAEMIDIMIWEKYANRGLASLENKQPICIYSAIRVPKNRKIKSDNIDILNNDNDFSYSINNNQQEASKGLFASMASFIVNFLAIPENNNMTAYTTRIGKYRENGETEIWHCRTFFEYYEIQSFLKKDQ